MSLILDALKKLDREKIERVAEKVDVTAGILKAGDAPRRRIILPLAVALGSTACVAALFTWLVVGGHLPRVGDSQLAVPAAPVQARTAAPKAPPVTTAGRGEPAAKKSSQARVPVYRGEAAVNDETVAAPSLKVSGIVWQEAPSDRKAVINGRVAREGDTGEGVRVVEIYPTFVNVSFKGRPFKVKMFD